MSEYNWRQPNPNDLQDASGPPLPDTETLVAELGAFYPMVSYPDVQEDDREPGAAVDETIFAALVSG